MLQPLFCLVGHLSGVRACWVHRYIDKCNVYFGLSLPWSALANVDKITPRGQNSLASLIVCVAGRCWNSCSFK